MTIKRFDFRGEFRKKTYDLKTFVKLVLTPPRHDILIPGATKQIIAVLKKSF